MKLLIQTSYRDITGEWHLSHPSPNRVREAIFRMLYRDGVGDDEINYVKVTPVD